MGLWGFATAQVMTTEFQQIAQVSISEVTPTLVVTNDDWAAAIGSSTMSKSTVVSNALFYSLSSGTQITAEITAIDGASPDQLLPRALDAIESLLVQVENGDSSGSGLSSGELWSNIAGTAAAETVGSAAVVVAELQGVAAHGRSSDADIGVGEGADVTFTITIDVEDGPTFPSTTLDITFTATSSD